jgi:hypothetical protein
METETVTMWVYELCLALAIIGALATAIFRARLAPWFKPWHEFLGFHASIDTLKTMYLYIGLGMASLFALLLSLDLTS